MKPLSPSYHNHEVLSALSRLPRKIIMLHGHEASALAPYVLHELSDGHCFNFKKAAYFVDNPDFNCLKGVAGFDHDEHDVETSLDSPHAFAEHLDHCGFNQYVRSLSHVSYKNSRMHEEDVIKFLARNLDINFHNASCLIWDMKHDNHGVLIYQCNDVDDEIREHLNNGVHLFSFCPIV